MLNIFRRTLLLAATAPLVLPAVAQDRYPAQPIAVIVPFAAGGNLDVTTRLVTTAMAKRLGQPLVVDNRAGAGGLIGHSAGARAQADGYTLTATANGSFVVTPKLQPGKRAFQTSDFRTIGAFGATPLVLEVPATSRFKSAAEFLSYAKANPGKLSVGHAGNGTTNHVAILQLQEAAGSQFTVVPYKGSGPALTDVLGGQIDAVVDQLPSSLSHLRAKKLRALAVTSANRAADLPDIPTLAELGLNGFDVSTVSGLLAPAKTPDSVINALSTALTAALKERELIDRLKELGSEPKPMTAQGFSALLAKEDAKAQKLIDEGKLHRE